jgi:hypothetical protein
MEIDSEYENEGKWLINNFPSLHSLTKYLEVNESVATKYNNSHKTTNYEFTKTNNFAEVFKILEHGSPEIMEGLKQAVKVAVNELKLYTRPEGYIADVEGLFFDVAKVIEGEPEAFYREPWDKKRKPRLSIPIIGSYRAKFKAETAIINASKVIAVIKAIEERGVDVELIMLFPSTSTTTKDESSCVSVKVKGYDEKFNWAKVSAMLHPSFFRRCIFRVMELQAPKTLEDSYGSAAGVELFKDTALSIQDEISILKFKETLGGTNESRK